MTAQERFGDLLKAIAPVLVDAGFKRRGSIFRRETDEVGQLVTLQKSRASSKEAVTFTVNLGISTAVLHFHGMVTSAVHDCPWHLRVGHLLPEKSDRWWRLDSTTDVVLLAAEMRTLVEQVILPKFIDLDRSDRLIDLWEQGQSSGITEGLRRVYLAVLLMSRGGPADLAAARELVRTGVPGVVWEFEDVLQPVLG